MRTERREIKAVGLFIGLCCFLGLAVAPTMRAQAPPRYKVDPSWPKEYPDNWILSNVHGIFVDKNDHIWVLTDPAAQALNEVGASLTPPHAICCVPSPSLMVLDTAGSVVKSWGHPGFTPDWPTAEHGLWVDGEGNVWLGGNAVGLDGKRPADRQVLKLSNDGKLLLEIGHPTKDPQNNQDTSFLGGPGEMTVDDAAHEVYIADGFLNKRVMVYDSNTGAFKRGWGAYGIPLSQIDNSKPAPHDPAAAPSKQFGGPVASVRISADGFVYVCDRTGDRIQVFTKEGKFVKEFLVHPETLDRGSAWGLTFSHDPKQNFLLVTDGEDGIIWILNRSDGKISGQFGHKGHMAGQFDAVQAISMDSHGNLYTAEVAPDHRVQKFILQK